MSTQFANIASIVAYAKSGAKLSALAASVLHGNKAEGLALLCDETIKAALAAALWNNPAKINAVIVTIREGKKTSLTKQWLKATTELCRLLPTNISGDTSRITEETTFVEYVNSAILSWNKNWADFEASQLLKKEQRAQKTIPETNTDTATDTDKATAATAAAATAAATDTEHLALLAERDALQNEVAILKMKLKGAYEEIEILRAATTPPARKRTKKAETAPQ